MFQLLNLLLSVSWPTSSVWGGDECAIVVFGTSPHRPSANSSMYAVSIKKAKNGLMISN